MHLLHRDCDPVRHLHHAQPFHLGPDRHHRGRSSRRRELAARLLHIFVPLSLNAFATVFILQFTWIWNDLLFGLPPRPKHRRPPDHGRIGGIQGQYSSTGPPVALAGALIVSIPTFVLFFGGAAGVCAGVAGDGVDGDTSRVRVGVVGAHGVRPAASQRVIADASVDCRESGHGMPCPYKPDTTLAKTPPAPTPPPTLPPRPTCSRFRSNRSTPSPSTSSDEVRVALFGVAVQKRNGTCCGSR